MKGAGGCDHPDGEVVVRDFQRHGSLKKLHHRRMELAAREELEARAIGVFADDLFTGQAAASPGQVLLP